MIYVNLFGGVMLLLFGIKLVSEGLHHAAGPRIRTLLRSLTSNRFAAVGAGAIITGIMQSSSATSVMLVGFVSAGLMSFRQTLAVILGADIGATITVQLIAFRITEYSYLLIGAGLVLQLFWKQQLHRQIGQGVLGFGFIFLSIRVMSNALAPLEESALFREVLIALLGSPFTGILLSAILTVLVQSSAATIGIALALAAHGLISLTDAIHLVLGANIGTCSTALMASLRSPAESRRVAWAHVLFKVFSVLLFLPLLGWFERLVVMTTIDPLRQIANANTLFNGIMAVLFLPFLGPFARLLERFVPSDREERRFAPMYLDEHVLNTPALALGQAMRETLRMSDIVRDMLLDSLAAFKASTHELIDEVKEKDNLVDMLDRHIRFYLTKLSAAPLTDQYSRKTVALLDAIRNLENIGDVLDRNIMPLAAKRISKGLMFSSEGMSEIETYHRKLLENYDMAISAFATSDRELAHRVLRNKEEFEEREREMTQAHLERLRKGLRETIETSHIHLDLIGGIARINSLVTHIVSHDLETEMAKRHGGETQIQELRYQ